jgi:outer membrane lipoprotein carrier protein
MRAAAASIALLSLAMSPAASQTPPAVHELVGRVQGHYDTVRDFKANFTQSYTSGGFGRKPRVETGDVRIKKPGRMWWRYEKPHKREYIADGVRIYEWDHADNSVATTDMTKLDENSTPLLFLTGRGNLVRDFSASLPARHPDGQWEINLKPKERQAEFTDVTIRVNRRSYAIEGLVTRDPQGGTSDMRFTSLRENNGFTDADFIFKIPKDAVIK